MNSIIEKIKSLLALASDPSTTEHERRLAFSRAKHLIERHAVKEQDLSDKTARDSHNYIPAVQSLQNFQHLLKIAVALNTLDFDLNEEIEEGREWSEYTKEPNILITRIRVLKENLNKGLPWSQPK